MGSRAMKGSVPLLFRESEVGSPASELRGILESHGPLPVATQSIHANSIIVTVSQSDGRASIGNCSTTSHSTAQSTIHEWYSLFLYNAIKVSRPSYILVPDGKSRIARNRTLPAMLPSLGLFLLVSVPAFATASKYGQEKLEGRSGRPSSDIAIMRSSLLSSELSLNASLVGLHSAIAYAIS
jgi:hypothetical protein